MITVLKLSLSAVVLALLLFLLPPWSAYPSAGDDWVKVVRKVEPSLVHLAIAMVDDETGLPVQGRCSGFVVKRGLVMTAAHCDVNEDISTVTINGGPVRVVMKEVDEAGVMILAPAKIDPKQPALRFADRNPENGSQVMSCGFFTRPLYRVSYVSDRSWVDDDGSFIMVDAGFLKGQSGGPLVNRRGEVVGVIEMSTPMTAWAVGVDLVRKHIKEYVE